MGQTKPSVKGAMGLFWLSPSSSSSSGDEAGRLVTGALPVQSPWHRAEDKKNVFILLIAKT